MIAEDGKDLEEYTLLVLDKCVEVADLIEELGLEDSYAPTIQISGNVAALLAVALRFYIKNRE
jgi:hypothetical protein